MIDKNQLFVVIQKRILEIESRPMMFTTRFNYQSLKNLVLGYFLGLEDITGVPLNSEFSEWLNAKSKIRSSLFWTEHIFHILAEEDEERAIKLLFKYVKEFLVPT